MAQIVANERVNYAKADREQGFPLQEKISCLRATVSVLLHLCVVFFTFLSSYGPCFPGQWD
ncbi:hypothetical protein A8C56_07830 [Niabella ginsenosidivorans]|uniref:Uncharacterized protein n=1 Tax=Niabella ginsenosidivorans TaxID=1176587 RepID=A0A1A9I2I2_9BACT|nr:hypothetical protein A8C56_07830 [Niabella ginsenosidivorans]